MWGGPISNSALIVGQSKPHVCSLAASAPDVRSDIAPNALSVQNSVFGLPGFRGAQEESCGM